MQAAGSTKVVQEARKPGSDDIVFEFMLNATRLLDGVEDGLFEARTGLGTGSLEPGLAALLREVYYPALSVVCLGYREADLGRYLDGHRIPHTDRARDLHIRRHLHGP